VNEVATPKLPPPPRSGSERDQIILGHERLEHDVAVHVEAGGLGPGSLP